LASFLGASHSLFRHRSRFVVPNDRLLEALEIELTDDRQKSGPQDGELSREMAFNFLLPQKRHIAESPYLGKTLSLLWPDHGRRTCVLVEVGIHDS